LRLLDLLDELEQVFGHLVDVIFPVASIFHECGRPELAWPCTRLLALLGLEKSQGEVETDSGDPARVFLLQAAVEQGCVYEVLCEDEVLLVRLC